MKKHSLPNYSSRISNVIVAAILAVSAFPSVFAASGTWTGLGGDGNWQTDANWSASPFPGTAAGVYTSTDIATFGVVGGGAINLGGTLNVGSILFGEGGADAGAFIPGDADDTLNLTSAGSIAVGGGVTSDQAVGVAGTVVNLSTTNNSTYSFLNFGSGSLTVGGAVTANQSVGNTSILTLGGSGNGLISGALSNAGTAGSSGLALVKNGGGTWTLSGANTYTGTTTVSGGQLVLDYASNTPIDSSAPLSINGGGVSIKGQSSGTTASSLSSVTLGGSTAAINSLTLDANGGSGVNLTIGTLNGFTSSLSGSLIDLSSSSGNSISVGALGSNISVANGVLMPGIGTSSSGRATLIVRDSTGYGFATLSDATSGTIGRLTTGTTLSASNTGATTNYRLTSAGTLTRTAGLNYSTLTIDSSAGAVTLDMATFNLASTANGRGILVTGSNDVSITGSGTLGTGPIIHNYGTGTLSLSLASGTFATTFLGTGFTDYSGTITSTGGNGGFVVGGGIVRLSTDQTMPTNTPFYVSGGGVLEIGADLNGAGTAGDFTIAVSNSTNSGIKFYTDAGVSAAGADRVVNFGGAGAALTWGSAGFLTNADGTTDGGYTLKLSSAKSDAKLTIENGIALGTNTNRVIDVANGTAATDATLSGVLSGSGATLVKQGTGTLELAAANTYSGGTVIREGTLALGASGSIGDSTLVDLNAGATFDTTAQSFVMLGTQTFNFTLDPTGGGLAGLLNADILDISNGVVTFATLGALNDSVYVIANYTGLVGTQFASVTAPTGYTINYSYEGNQIALEVIPEPGSTAMVLFGLGMLVGFQRVRRRR